MNNASNFQNKFHLISLGCPRNLVDSEVMLGLLRQAGYECTPFLSDADFVIINTCSFLQASRNEGYDTIHEIFKSKKKNAKVIISGCMVQHCKEELVQRFPGIHYFVGSGDVDQILRAFESGSRGESISSAKSFLECGEIPRTISTPQHYAYLKIAEGCRKRCAFCIIPSIKGPLRSKSIDQVIREFKALLDRGVFEIILIAQDLGDFGKDRGQKGELSALLREIMKEPRDFWLRLLYLYPDEIDDELIQTIKSDARICPYLDMPIQHIDDEILHSMRRKTSRAQITGIIQKLRNEIPDISIRTSLIVGFPGETEKHFQELVNFVKQQKLEQVGIFKFSPEKDSAASVMQGQVAEDEKQRRQEVLAKAQMKVVNANNRAFIGKRLSAIIDGVHPESNLLLAARHGGQCPDIDGQIIINDAAQKIEQGRLYTVEITDVAGYDLIGRICKKK